MLGGRLASFEVSEPLCQRCIGVSRISLLSSARCRQPQPRSEWGKDFRYREPSGRESPEQLSSELCRMPLPVRCAELRTR